MVGTGAMRYLSVGWQSLQRGCESGCHEPLHHPLEQTSQVWCQASQVLLSWKTKRFLPVEVRLARKFLSLLQILTALSFPKWGQKMEILLGWCPRAHSSCAFALCTQKRLWFHPVAHGREMGSCQLLHNPLPKY